MIVPDKKYINHIMLEQLFESADIHSLFERINSDTGISIAIFEMSGTLITGVISPGADRVLQFVVENGHMPRTFISQHFKGDQLVSLNSGGHIYIDMNDIGCNYIYCSFLPAPINEADRYLCIYFPATIEKSLVEYMAEKIFRIISIESRGGMIQRENNFFENYIAKELLAKDDDVNASFFWELVTSNHSQGENYLDAGYMIAELSDMDEGSRLFSVTRKLKHHISNCLCHMELGVIRVIIYNVKDMDDYKKYITMLNDFSVMHNLYCGCSSWFDKLADRTSFKREAHAALKCGLKEFPNSTMFSGVELSGQMLLYGAIKQTGTNVLVLDDIKCLAEYDRLNSTDYVNSLATYLFYGNRLSDAAQALFIDRNTLKYRIRKISSILNCNLEDPTTAKNLYLAMEIHKHMKSV